MNDNGLIVVGTRLAAFHKQNGHAFPILLPDKAPYTIMYCTNIHNECHGGIDDTILKIRLHVWVPKLRTLVKKIKKRCIRCQ